LDYQEGSNSAHERYSFLLSSFAAGELVSDPTSGLPSADQRLDREDITALPPVSRRSFLQGAGVSAIGASILEVGEAATRELANGRGEAIGPGAVAVTLDINGERREVQVDPATTLVELLRDGLGMTGTKIGCDRGACSACTVWVDEEVVASCMTLVLDVRGKKITTIEGLAKGETLHPVQQAFVEHDALQCGFCTPGMVMSCARLVEQNPNCSLEDVRQAISGHLCRCGTYPNIFKATLAAASRMREV
jgi:carbon-monoxide dehydrogenase small subunit/xanthine dehydrogenase YagT iron-sulfur-binding subunit